VVLMVLTFGTRIKGITLKVIPLPESRWIQEIVSNIKVEVENVTPVEVSRLPGPLVFGVGVSCGSS